MRLAAGSPESGSPRGSPGRRSVAGAGRKPPARPAGGLLRRPTHRCLTWRELARCGLPGWPPARGLPGWPPARGLPGRPPVRGLLSVALGTGLADIGPLGWSLDITLPYGSLRIRPPDGGINIDDPSLALASGNRPLGPPRGSAMQSDRTAGACHYTERLSLSPGKVLPVHGVADDRGGAPARAGSSLRVEGRSGGDKRDARPSR